MDSERRSLTRNQTKNQNHIMARNSVQTPKTDDLAQQVSDKIAQQHHELTNRNWAAIKEVMDNDEDHEIKLQFSTVVTNRPAEQGAVASKDSRIETVLAFSLGKQSDKVSSPFPLANQMELPTE